MHSTKECIGDDDDLNSDDNSGKSYAVAVISDNNEDSETEVNIYIIVGYTLVNEPCDVA